MKETIVILSHASPDNLPYVSYVHNHAIALSKLGYKVIVFALINWFPFLKPNKLFKGIKTIDGVEVHYLNRLSFSKLFDKTILNVNGELYYKKIKRTIKKIIKNENVILVDAHYFKIEGHAAYRIKKKFHLNTFITLHGTDFNDSLNCKNGIKKIKKTGNVIDKYICVSEKIQKQLNELNINNSSVIYNGINIFDINRNNKNYDIITGTSLISIKNIDLVIKAFKKIIQVYPKSRLKIIGHGPLKPELEKLTIDLKISDKVEFLGQLTNKEVFSQLSNSNVFVMVSKPEGFGIIYAEAMYCGCITVGTKGEGIDGFINDENGYLINPDENEIFDIICKIFNINQIKIQDKAINDVKKLTWKSNAEKYIKELRRSNEK